MSANAPVASVRSIGNDPEPYYFPDTDTRSYRATYRVLCIYSPRPDFTHLPAAPSELFCGFREQWRTPEINGAYDLGEYAQIVLDRTPEDGTQEVRLYRRFLELCAAVLPRPYYELERELGVLAPVS